MFTVVIDKYLSCLELMASAAMYLRKAQKTIKYKKPTNKLVGFVVPPGIEPGTHGFSVHCSTI